MRTVPPGRPARIRPHAESAVPSPASVRDGRRRLSGRTPVEIWRKCHEMLDSVTPLRTDCGALCGARCCRGGPGDGMLLFPEEALLYSELVTDLSAAGLVSAGTAASGETAAEYAEPAAAPGEAAEELGETAAELGEPAAEFAEVAAEFAEAAAAHAQAAGQLKDESNHGGWRLTDSRIILPGASDPVKLLICSGSCSRRFRPMACRMFPLLPWIDRHGRVRIRPDLRAYAMCPLLSQADAPPIDPVFSGAVRDAMEAASVLPGTRLLLELLNEEASLLRKFYGLDI
jgi:hypothetical protein